MLKLRGSFLSSINITRRTVIIIASIMVVIVILDLLMTRQLLPYNTTSETIMFVPRKLAVSLDLNLFSLI
jgi:hypothetical protein